MRAAQKKTKTKARIMIRVEPPRNEESEDVLEAVIEPALKS